MNAVRRIDAALRTADRLRKQAGALSTMFVDSNLHACSDAFQIHEEAARAVKMLRKLKAQQPIDTKQP